MRIKSTGEDMIFLEHLKAVKVAAQTALAPIRPTDDSTSAPKNLLFLAQRTRAGRNLPPYYLVYFLLVDLLGFRDLGAWEKLSWSVPVDFHGKAYLIEHRKLGAGLFVENPDKWERDAEEIVTRIQKATKAAQPYFEWYAQSAVADSKLNVKNDTDALHQRFQFFLEEYWQAIKEREKEEERKRQVSLEDLMKGWTGDYFLQPFTLAEKSTWLASAAIDAFFSFTEHVFIHLAILQGRVNTRDQVASLAGAEWNDKFKAAFDIADRRSKQFYDDLGEIRKQHRNFVAHGAFGKRGEAFTFHSGAGAVPVLLPHQRGSRKFAFHDALTDEEPKAVQRILAFMDYLWAEDRAPARLYLQRSNLPVIMTLAADGTYKSAMRSTEEMESLVDHLVKEWDRAANMDW